MPSKSTGRAETPIMSDSARHGIISKIGEKDAVIFDMRFDAKTMGIYFEPKAAMPTRQYESNPNVINLNKIRESLYKSGEATFENIICGGGSSMILELPDGVQYFISTYRDAKAPRFPSMLDDTGGIVNTLNPLQSSIREVAEEIIIVDRNSAVIPQFPGGWSEYNKLISDTVPMFSRQFGITDTHLVRGSTVQMREPLYFESKKDMPMGIALIELVIGEPLIAAVLIIPPLILKQDSIGSFRETLAIETKGAAPERDVVLVKITESHPERPDVIVYNKGERTEEHVTFNNYTEKRFNGVLAVAPSLSATFRFIGLGEHPVGLMHTHPTLPELRS